MIIVVVLCVCVFVCVCVHNTFVCRFIMCVCVCGCSRMFQSRIVKVNMARSRPPLHESRGEVLLFVWLCVWVVVCVCDICVA